MQANHFDVRAARERLELGTEALAAELQVTEGEVRAWESGAIRIPRNARRALEYRVAHAEWSAGMAASGLPECEWLKSERAKLVLPRGTEEMIRLAGTVRAHMWACEVCTARERWAKEHLPPFPLPPAKGAVGTALGAIQRLPAWARPAAWGGLAMAAMTAARALLMLATTGWRARDVLEAAGAVLLAAAAGAAGGLVYTLTRPATRRLGTAGDYLSGILASTAFVGAAVAVLPFVTRTPMLDEAVRPAGAIIFALTALLFGLIVGKMTHDGERLKKATE